jgi:ATP-binding cassette subfamily F protein uup
LRLLEEALVAFGGSVIVVSHDRYFLNRVCTAILSFEGEGVLRYGVGNYDYYLEKRSEETKATSLEPVKSGASPRPAAKPRKLKWKEERELEGMEAAILAAENEVARLEALFAEPDFYTTHAADYAKFEAELRDARDKVARLYARWAELGEVTSASGS